LIKQPKLFYRAAFYSSLRYIRKTEVDTIFAAGSGLPCAWQDRMATGHYIKNEYY